MEYSKCLVVIPTYNEVDNIGKLITKITSLYNGIKILVVDDNSPDGTFKLVIAESKNNPNVSLLLGQKKEGFSHAYQKAFTNIQNRNDIEWVVVMDADFSHSPDYIDNFIKSGANFDMVIGSRFVKGGSAPGMNFKRRYLSYLGNLYARLITGLKIKDLTTGFIAFNIKVIPAILDGGMVSKGFACLMEMKFKVVIAGFNWTEIPIIFGSREKGYSKISWGIIWEGLLTPWRLKFSKNV